MSIIRSIKHRLGLSVTPANNFTFDASADNGTMKLARESGQDIMTVDAAGKVAFPQNVRAWQDVLASRAKNTTYTNITGQEIVVAMIVAPMNAGNSLVMKVNGVNISQQYVSASNTGLSAQVTVPNGATYYVELAGPEVPSSWKELR